MQIVKWGTYPPVFEKREYWFDDEDQEKTGKLKGMNIEDIQLLLDNKEDVLNLMGLSKEQKEIVENL